MASFSNDRASSLKVETALPAQEPLKTIGVTMVEIKLHADVVVEVEVRVIRETG